MRTTYASAIYADHVPRDTAPAVAALEAEGAIVVGKANADEFAWGVCGQNAHFGDVVNPAAPGPHRGRLEQRQRRRARRRARAARARHRHRRLGPACPPPRAASSG